MFAKQLLVLLGVIAAVSAESLTPLIEKGEYRKAQEASRVFLPGVNIVSYSGYVTVNASAESETFFWYFPPLNGNTSAPTLMWLQGGPGASSLYALFTENGPLVVNTEGTHAFVNAETSWAREYGMVFVDNPVGVGFSKTLPAGYAQGRDQYMTTLYSFISQFHQLFPHLQQNDFFITGESYGGKYVPAAAYKVHEENAKGTKPHIPLKGIIIGDGLCDPETMVQQYAFLTEGFSLVDWNQVKTVKAYSDKIVSDIKSENWADAFHQFDLLINGDLSGVTPYLANVTGFSNYFNALSPVYPTAPFDKYLNLPEIQKALHVNKTFAGYTRAVEVAIVNDVAQSMKDLFPTLLANYKVLLYSGQFDVIVGAPLTIAFIRSIQWPGAATFETAERKIWRSRSPVIGTMGQLQGTTDVAGYHTQSGNLEYVVVRNAGHMVPSDQPIWALDMITRFIKELPFDGPVPKDIPDPKPPTTLVSDLTNLAELHRTGALTDSEFAAAKAKLIQ
eukprot:TRINITY_DN33592_c0_g1_i1.p1 TRINITY_DN33592_c0_g1~~TRINITY_DN33592_c0_g1_i1.p1  ORF type:complete len:504 (+),score=118.19 TRINITY_DN33592_c0_g1_i1:34-1545(+)